MAEYQISLQIGQRTLTVQLPVYSTFQNLSDKLIEDKLINQSDLIDFQILSTNKFIDDLESFIFSTLSSRNDSIKVIYRQDLAQVKLKLSQQIEVKFRINKTNYTVSQNFKDDIRLEQIIKYFQQYSKIQNEIKNIIFYNSRNNIQAFPTDFINQLNPNNQDLILIFQDEDEFQRYQIQKERQRYQEINKSKCFMEVVQCKKVNHEPNMIQFICKNNNCDQTPICCSLCFHEIHNNHKDINDFIQLNSLEKEDFQDYEKLRAQILHIKLHIQELLDGLDNLVLLLNPSKGVQAMRQNPGYQIANKLGYCIRFFYQIPGISKKLEQMKLQFQTDLENIYKKLKLGINYNEIIKISKQEHNDIDIFTKNSQIAKNMKFGITSTIKKLDYNEKDLKTTQSQKFELTAIYGSKEALLNCKEQKNKCFETL